MEHVRDETSGISPGPSGCRDGVGTGVERVITYTVNARGTGAVSCTDDVKDTVAVAWADDI